MKMLVDNIDITRSSHVKKKILLVTMILCYAHDRLSHHHLEAFESAKFLSIRKGGVFDCLPAQCAKGNADTIWTENMKDFERYDFLNVENPLEWE